MSVIRQNHQFLHNLFIAAATNSEDFRADNQKSKKSIGDLLQMLWWCGSQCGMWNHGASQTLLVFGSREVEDA
jgi:hypothetical protein